MSIHASLILIVVFFHFSSRIVNNALWDQCSVNFDELFFLTIRSPRSYIYRVGYLWFLRIWCLVPPGIEQERLFIMLNRVDMHNPVIVTSHGNPPTTSQQHGSVDKRVGSTVHSVGDPLWGDMVTPPLHSWKKVTLGGSQSQTQIWRAFCLILKN